MACLRNKHREFIEHGGSNENNKSKEGSRYQEETENYQNKQP